MKIEWIDVNQEQPPTPIDGKYGPRSVPVLCYSHGEMHVAVFNRPKDYEPWWMDKDQNEVYAAYWMLPAPPSTDKEGE